MPTYKFHVDQTVYPTPSHALNIPGGAYIVTQKLPERDGEFEYYVKSINEPHERIVRESQIREIPQLPKSLFLPKRQERRPALRRNKCCPQSRSGFVLSGTQIYACKSCRV
jgi:hypothetical protein